MNMLSHFVNLQQIVCFGSGFAFLVMLIILILIPRPLGREWEHFRRSMGYMMIAYAILFALEMLEVAVPVGGDPTEPALTIFIATYQAALFTALSLVFLRPRENFIRRFRLYLAAAPYYKNYSDPGSTTWGKAFSSSDATCRTNSYQPTIIAGYNHEITFPVLGTKLGEVDVTAKFKMDFQDSYETSSSTSFGESHGATDDDRVIMQVSPYDTYTYRIIASDNPDELGGLIQISSPLQRMFLGLTLNDYTRMIADQPNVPNLSGYFQHIPGQPFTYPSDELMIHSQAENPCFMWGRDASNNTAVVSCGAGGFTSRSISMQNDTTTSNSQSYGFELELVVTLGNVKAGAGFGYNHTNETSHTVSETHEVSAQVNGLPSANDADHPMFRWNFVWYKESLNGQEFPVIQYMVKR